MNQKTISLDEVKIAVIKKILDDKVAAGEIQSQEQYDAEYKILYNKVQSTKTITTLKEQSGLTDAKSFNENIVDLYIDLLTAFGAMNELDQAVNRHKKLNESIINSLKTQVAKMNDEVSNYEQIIKEQWNSDNYTEGFRDVGCFEENNNLYTERDGTLMSSSYKAVLDKFNESINLPYITKTNVLIHQNGTPLATASLPKQLGSGLITIKNERNSLDKAIDTSTDTYWAECILCDTPMRVELSDYYYNTNFGAVCEIEISLQTPTVVNEISLLPYGPYPMEIIAIRYFETDEPSEPIKEIVFPGNTDKTLDYQRITGSISFKFTDRLCKRIRILINQIHYIKNNFIVDKEEQSKNELWFNSTGTVIPKLEGHEVFKPVYYDKALKDRAWVIFNNSIGDVANIDVTKLMETKKSMKPVSKYQYVYGFYNIGVYYNDFQDTGIFVSKTIKSRGNIKTVTLESKEIHPGNQNCCDIEYYISYADNPQAEDWIPLLPMDKEVIHNELLTVWVNEGLPYYLLRFPAKGNIIVKANGIVLSPMYYNTRTDSNGNINRVAILPYKKPNVKYTVEYTPVDKAKRIDFIDSNVNPIVSADVIPGTNTNYYSLSNIPFLYEGMVMNVQITTKDGNLITQQRGDIQNVTDIYSPSESYKNFTTGKLQYYVDKDKLYFNQDIAAGNTIKIEYSHFVTQIRVKAILRRNCQGNNWITPSIDEFRVKFQVIE